MSVRRGNTADTSTAGAAGLAAIAIAVAVLLIVAEVVLRYVFAAPTVWTTEIVLAACAIAYFLGGPEAERRGAHIRIAVLGGRRDTAARAVAAVRLACAAIFLSGLAYAASLQFWHGVWRFDDGLWRPETTGRAWNVPLPPIIRGVLLFSCLLWLAVLFRHRPGQAVVGQAQG